MLALANSVCLRAWSSGMYERESTAKHGTARHSRTQHGTARRARHRARHRTALRRAVELAKLNGAGDTAVFLLCFQLYAAGCDPENELDPARTEND